MNQNSSPIHFQPFKVEGRPVKISIFSPTYNHGKFIRQNIEGILNQTYSHFELIIVNDGSTDDTHEIVTECAAKDPRIRYHRFEKHQGMQDAFEHGYSMTTGDLIYPSASDDYLSTPSFFEQVIRSFEKAPQAAGVFGQSEMISTETSRPIGLLGSVGNLAGYVPPQAFREHFFTHRAIIPGVSSIWRKDCVTQIGGYPRELGPQHDYFLNHSLASLAGVVFLPKKVAMHRITTNSYNAKVDFHQRIRNYVLVEKKMRALGIHQGIDQGIFLAWRKQLIDNLMMGGAQRQMFDFFKEITGSLGSEFWSYVPESPAKFFHSIPVEVTRLEKEMAELQTWAEQEFKKETGC